MFLQNFVLHVGRDGPVKVQKQGSNEKTQDHYTLLWNNGGKEKQEDYPTSTTNTHCRADVG